MQQSSYIYWFTPQMAVAPGARSRQNQGPGTPFGGSPSWWQKLKSLGHLVLPSHVHWQNAGSKQSSQDGSWSSSIGCRHFRLFLSSLCHSSGQV